MAHSSLSPGFVKMFYTGPTGNHVMTLPVQPAAVYDPGDNVSFVQNNDEVVTMSVALAAFTDVLKTEIGVSVTISRAEYWQMPDPDDDPIFITAVVLNVVGTAGTDSSPARQAVISYRTTLGHNAFLYIMDATAAIAATTRENFPTNRSTINTLSAYLTGLNGWVRGRDGGKFLAPIWFTGKVNDALRKRFYNL